jgi:RNA polymerase sigma-70 factor, ECF subfamily
MEIDPAEWRRHQRYLLAVAYRLLGSLTDAEDAVQEAYLRLASAEGTDINDVRSWLATVVSRICLDQLRSARVRRESYVGPWLPEPLVGDTLAPAPPELGPADRVTLSESVHMAMLIVLENLSPAERTAFILHDVFGLDFPQIGQVVGRSARACRQLAFRARQHVRAHAPHTDVDAGELDRIVSAFHAAARTGDIDTLTSLLHPDVVMRSDGGGKAPAALHPVHGATAVARLVAGLTARRDTGLIVRMVPVNGEPGFLLKQDNAVAGVGVVTTANGQITAIDLIVNPDKLSHIDPSSETSRLLWAAEPASPGNIPPP